MRGSEKAEDGHNSVGTADISCAHLQGPARPVTVCGRPRPFPPLVAKKPAGTVSRAVLQRWPVAGQAQRHCPGARQLLSARRSLLGVELFSILMSPFFTSSAGWWGGRQAAGKVGQHRCHVGVGVCGGAFPAGWGGPRGPVGRSRHCEPLWAQWLAVQLRDDIGSRNCWSSMGVCTLHLHLAWKLGIRVFKCCVSTWCCHASI